MSTSFNIDCAWIASRQTTGFPFYHDLFHLQRWSSCCHERNVFGRHLARDLCHSKQRVSPYYHVSQLLHEKNVFRSPGNGMHHARVTANNGFHRSIMIWVWIWLAWLGTFLDCRTTSPSGRWATSEPNSFIQSFFNEIFGEGRGDAHTFSYMISPVSIRTTFGIQQAGSVSWRMIPFFRARLISTQFSPFWCLFHALCMYCARCGASKSIVSGSLWFLYMGSTGRKNTVCLLLKFWPPGINPEWMMECKLIAHPTW